MTSRKDDFLGRIEAEQSLIMKFIEDNKRHCEHSDVLVNAARDKRKRSESEGELEDA